MNTAITWSFASEALPNGLDVQLGPFESPQQHFDMAHALRALAAEVERRGHAMKQTQTAPPAGDRLLDVHEAAKKLGRSEDWLYRRARKLPFTRPDGRSLQFSEKGIEEYIQKGEKA